LPLEAARATSVLLRFNNDSIYAKFKVAEPIHFRIIAFCCW